MTISQFSFLVCSVCEYVTVYFINTFMCAFTKTLLILGRLSFFRKFSENFTYLVHLSLKRLFCRLESAFTEEKYLRLTVYYIEQLRRKLSRVSHFTPIISTTTKTILSHIPGNNCMIITRVTYYTLKSAYPYETFLKTFYKKPSDNFQSFLLS